MAKNGYFQLEKRDGRIWLRVVPAGEGGEMFQMDEVLHYLERISFPEYDMVALDAYLKQMEFSRPFMLTTEDIIPEREKCVVTIADKGVRALARFYPPMEGAASLTEEDIISDLQFAGIKHGIKRKAIQHFLTHHEYCRDYIIAEATLPRQGHDASVEYFFDLNTTAKPKLNEDGSVDFHQLGNIKPVSEGDKLAVLTPLDRGRPGISVLGTPLPPKKVKNCRLRYGRNIRLSENKCELYSKVDGHVTLVDDMVMVSDVYQVSANVDASTGDITYKGTVEVTGNVNTGYKVEAEGDIIVNGVVEGAVLSAGGNIVLKCGMQGMERGELKAAGNVTAKFLENCKVECGGSLRADAILHSQVFCRDEIEVLGRKGLINGGSVKTYANIHCTALGSNMGSSTQIEIISDVDDSKRANELREKIEDIEISLEKIDQMAENIRKMKEAGTELLPEQKEALKKATVSKPQLIKESRQMRQERERILARIAKDRSACVKVEDVVYSGVRLMVKDAQRTVKEQVSHCRFVREGADVKMTSL